MDFYSPLFQDDKRPRLPSFSLGYGYQRIDVLDGFMG